MCNDPEAGNAWHIQGYGWRPGMLESLTRPTRELAWSMIGYLSVLWKAMIWLMCSLDCPPGTHPFLCQFLQALFSTIKKFCSSGIFDQSLTSTSAGHITAEWLCYSIFNRMNQCYIFFFFSSTEIWGTKWKISERTMKRPLTQFQVFFLLDIEKNLSLEQQLSFRENLC